MHYLYVIAGYLEKLLISSELWFVSSGFPGFWYSSFVASFQWFSVLLLNQGHLDCYRNYQMVWPDLEPSQPAAQEINSALLPPGLPPFFILGAPIPLSYAARAEDSGLDSALSLCSCDWQYSKSLSSAAQIHQWQ